jgi:hypothetical protein
MDFKCRVCQKPITVWDGLCNVCNRRRFARKQDELFEKRNKFFKKRMKDYYDMSW